MAYKQDDPVLVPLEKFPNHLATDAEKESYEYGLSCAQAIQHQWFRTDGNGSNCRFYDQWSNYHNLRLYARGEQDVQKYKNELSINGDLSYLNLDWTPVPIIPKFVDIVVNGMRDRQFTVKAKSEDVTSAEKKHSYQQVIEKDMLAFDFLQQNKEQIGVDAFNIPAENVPADDQELQLHMQLKYKPGIEIAEEIALNTIFEMNDYEEVKDRFNRDIAELGKGIQKHRYSYNEGIKIEYVDPQNTIHSFSEDPFHRDIFYVGEVKQIPITELKKINPNLTPEDIEEISESSGMWNTQYKTHVPYTDSVFQKDVVNVLFFNYKTDKRYVWKKKFTNSGGERMILRDETLPPPQDPENPLYERIEEQLDTWYEGVLVLGTEHLLEWKPMTNMVRPESAFQKSYSNYVIIAPKTYKGSEESLVRRMIPYADLIQVTHLKLQQVLAKMVPDGVFIDVDGISEIDLGSAGEYTPEKAMEMYWATGSVMGRSYTGEGEFNNARVPIQELNTSSGQPKLQTLVAAYNHYLNMIRDVTGLNEARDASTPDPNSLVGLQKLAALNSNVATLHILEAGLHATKRMAECISIRIGDILQWADDREEFANMIGQYNVSVLEDVRNLYLHSFGIFIEVSPDAQEKDELERNINTALGKEQIGIEDVIDIREIKNIKLANEMLKLKKRKKEQADRAFEMQKIEKANEGNMAAQQAASESNKEKVMLEAKLKMEVDNNKGRIEQETMTHEANLKHGLMQEEKAIQLELANITNKATMDKESMKEDRKDERIDKQSTQQSKMITQRQKQTPAVDFESNEDTLDGFGFEEFG